MRRYTRLRRGAESLDGVVDGSLAIPYYLRCLGVCDRMPDHSNLTPSQDRKHPATIVSWLALAVAILIVGYVVQTRVDPRDLLPFGKDASGLPAVGDQAPDFSAVNAEGEMVSLSDYHGQPVWLNFWGSWCPPCRAETPDLIAAYEKLKSDDLVLIAVSLEEPSADAFAYAERSGIEFVVLSDPDRDAIRDGYRVRSFPTHLFIDREGVVREIKLYPLSTQLAIDAAQSVLDD